MINDIRLYIDKEQVEFKDTPEILYNWAETDFTNPVATKNSYSKTITIQGTQQNNKIFGHFWNLERYQMYNSGTGSDFNPSYKVPFTLYVNGNVFEQGYIKLQKVTKKNGIFEYEISLFGGLGSFLYNLSVNEDDGSIKTFNSLNFYLNNELADFSFHINKETVKEAWNNINNSSSKWNTINFAPAYSGIPDKFDANKVLVNFRGISGSTLTQKVFEDNVYYYPQGGNSENTAGYSVAELPASLDMWQVKDLRSYLQIPVIRVKSIFEALQRPENSKGKFDKGYEVVLDKEFFNSNNPYYQDSYITLPKITTLTFTEGDGGETIEVTGFTTDIVNVHTEVGVTENTTFTFQLPETINTGNYKAHIKFKLLDTVTRTGTAHPDVQYLYLQPAFVGPELLWYSEHRTGLGAQLLAVSSNNTILTGSSIDWYTSVNYDSVYFSCQDAINYGTYKPKYSTSVVNKKTGYFTFVETAATGSIYSFTEMELEVNVPIGTNKIQLNVQRCPERGEADEIMYGNKLFQYGYHDTPEDTFYGKSNGDRSSGTVSITVGGAGEDNFFSNRLVKQSELLTTDYSISDWLVSYCKMFGLYLHKDVAEDKIYIDTRNTYYQKDNIENVEELIDYSKDFTINPIYISNKFYTLTNPMEKTKYSETYLSDNGNNYGMKLINTGFEFDASRKELLNNYKIKSAIPANKQDIYNFKPLDGINPYVYNGFKYKLYAYGDIDYDKTVDIEVNKKQIYKVYNDLFFNQDFPYYDSFYKLCFENEGKEVNSANVFVFLNGFKNVSNYGYFLTDDLPIMSKLNNNPCWIMTKTETAKDGSSIGIKLEEIPQFSTYYAPEEKILYSSNFGSPREFFVRQGELVNNDDGTLYNMFYSKYYEDLFDINTKVVDCFIKPKGILNSESLRKFYWFNNSLWRLNKITEYSPIENRTVRCQFVKIQDLNAISNEVPSKDNIFQVTVSKQNVANTGETITGKVISSRNWIYEGSNYSDIVVTPASGVGDSDITVRIPFYSLESRVINLRFSSGEKTVTIPIQQAATNKYFMWENGETAITITHDSTSGSSLTAYETNYLQNEFGFLPTTPTYMKYPAILYHNNNFTFSFVANSGTSEIEESINIVRTSDSGVIGTITFIQSPPERRVFYWTETLTTGLTKTVESNVTSLTARYSTDYPNISFTASSGATVTDSNQQITVSFTENTGSTSKVYTVNVYSDTTLVGNLTITQQGKVSPIKTITLIINSNVITCEYNNYHDSNISTGPITFYFKNGEEELGTFTNVIDSINLPSYPSGKLPQTVTTNVNERTQEISVLSTATVIEWNATSLNQVQEGDIEIYISNGIETTSVRLNKDTAQLTLPENVDTIEITIDSINGE